MKTTHKCTKCGAQQVLEVREVAERSRERIDGRYTSTVVCAKLARYPREIVGGEVLNPYPSSEGDLEAWTCPKCGFTELYVKSPGSVTVDNDAVRLHAPLPAQTLQAKVDYLELALSSLMELLRVRTGITSEELSVMMGRLDLADGVEDGKIGPDATQNAPTCPACGRPVNPSRPSCLFCNAPVEVAATAPPNPSTRTVTCTRCGATTAETDSYFSGTGLVCPKCFSGA